MRLGVSAALIGDKLVTGDLEIEAGVVKQFGIGRGTGSHLAVPGFVDIHIHGREGVDFTEAGAYEFVRTARGIAATGTTAFQPTLVSRPVEELVSAISRHPGEVEGGARVLGFHLEGPFLSPDHPGAHRSSHLTNPTRDVAERLVDAGPVSQMTMAPELEGAIPVIEYLAERGVVVSLGHSGSDAATAAKAMAAGASAYTHVFNAMRPFTHRDPGIVGTALADGRAFITGVFDDAHLSSEAARILIGAAGDRLIAITDGTPAIGQQGGKTRLGGRLLEVVDGAPRLHNGVIAGSILTMDAAFRNLLDLGLTIADASRATSSNPATLAGMEEAGSLTPGSPADLVVLDERFGVVRTLVGGVEVFG